MSEQGVQIPESELRALQARVKRLEDIEEIRQLRALYSIYLDGGWREQGGIHMGPFQDLFTEDGVWDGRPFAAYAVGRREIYEKIVRGVRPLQNFVIHNLLNSKIEIDGDTATGRWQVITPVEPVDGPAMLVFGTYHDEYARTEEGWRFKSVRAIIARTSVNESGWHKLPES